LARNGQRGAALAQYETCKKVLRDELGAAPDAQTQALVERIREALLGPEAESSLAAVGNARAIEPDRLPAPLTSFIGRERELDEIIRLLGYPQAENQPSQQSKTRLLTLTGAGGCGKTRLAIAVARRLSEARCCLHGVRWVDFSLISDLERVASATIAALGLGEMGGIPALRQLENYLRDRQILLVIDNCEHMVEAIAIMADKLLYACPGLQILATSRELLGVQGEILFPVPGLNRPDILTGKKIHPDEMRRYNAVQLFEERAKTALPGWTLEENTEGVLAICAQLDGIPLAIELAATRVRMMTVGQIQTRLRDVFQLLTSGSRATIPRHQTLRACIDWSYTLLSEEERILLRYLSVFSGGWTLEAAEAIGKELLNQGKIQKEPISLLGWLVDRSLVVAEQQKSYGTRYRMLETIRQYIHEKLMKAGEEESAQRLHLNYFLALAVQAEPELRGPDQDRWMNLIETNLDNFRTSLEWAVAADTNCAMRISSSLLWFWHGRDYAFEGWEWFERCLLADENTHSSDPKNDPDHAGVRAQALGAAFWLLSRLSFGGYNGSTGNFLPFSRREEGEQKLASYMEEAMDIYQRMPKLDRSGLAFLYLRLGINTRDVTESKVFLEKSLSLSMDEGDKFLAAECMSRFARAAVAEGDIELAIHYNDKELAFRSAIGDKEGLIYTHIQKGIIAYYHLHDYSLAGRQFMLASQYGGLGNNDNLFHTKFDYSLFIYLMKYLALVAWKQNNLAEALRLIELSLVTSLEVGDEVVVAFSLGTKGRILLQEDPHQAMALFRDAVMLWKKNFFVPYGVPRIAEDLVCLYQQEGQAERAATLLGFVWNHQHFEEFVVLDFPRIDPIRNALQITLGTQAFDRAWAEGQAMTLEIAADYVMKAMEISG
jgi:predicted ATPase